MRELRNEVGEEIKEFGIFNPPRRLFCWNEYEVPVERDVTAVALCRFGFVAVTFDGEMFSHCATIGNSKDLKGGRQMSELKARHVVDVYDEYSDNPNNEAQVYLKSEVDKFIADLEESHKMEVEQLLMKIAGLEKLVETADKVIKQKGGFTIKDIKFGGVKLEGLEKEGSNAVDKSNA